MTVRAGTPLSELTAALADHGLMLENMGDIDDQSVAGALPTGTHGTGTDFGVMSTQAAGMRLVTADGETLDLERGDDRFPFAQVSLGALGVVSTGRPGRRDAVEERLENLAWEGLCRAGYRVRSAAPALNRFTAATFSESERVGPAREIYPTTRAVRFDETEYSVPRSDAAPVLEDLRGVVESHGVMFPVEFRDVAADSVPISPAYGRDSTFVAVHAYHRRDHEELIRDAEAVFDRYDGRPHWGKHHTKTASDFEALYPRWAEFCEVREALDPEGLFLNDHHRAVFEG